jgi:hypothetical protein
VEAIWNEHDEAIDRAPNAMMTVKMKVPFVGRAFRYDPQKEIDKVVRLQICFFQTCRLY